MPLREETFDFEDEEARIEDELEAIANDVAQANSDSPERQRLMQEGRELDAHLKGVRWAQDAHDDESVSVWDDDIDAITLGGLTGGEYGSLEDELAGRSGGNGAVRTILVARGTVEAPYLGEDDKTTLGNVASLPVPFLKWAQSHIDDLTTPSGNGGSGFEDYLAAARKD